MTSHNDTEPTPPWLASIPLMPGHQALALVIVHPGRAVVPAEGLGEVLRFWADGRGGWIGAARAAHGPWGYIDGEGRWRVPPTLQNARSFSEDGLARFCDGGRWGFMDLAGTVAIPPAFDNAQPFRNGLCAVQVGQDAWRIIDRTGHTTCDEVFHELSPFGANGLARATLWKKASNQRTQGFVDRTGRWVIEPRFRDARPFGESTATAASLDGDTYGLIDAQGRWVLEPRYPRIDAFNAEGLAFFDEPHAWDNGHGYLNARGKVVVKGGRHLSRRMACGVAANSYDGTGFLTADGKPLAAPPLSYGTDFSAESGFAVVRTAAAVRKGAADATTAAPAHWGLLHPDGRFVPAPDHLLEPLTDGDGWLVGHPPDTPLVPFLTRDGQLAFIDGEGAVAWRAHYDGQQVALLDAGGTPLWRSGVRENCWPPGPFFHAPLTDHLENLKTLDGIVPLAVDLLADAEARLHRLAAGDELAPDEPVDGDDEDDDDDGEQDPGQVQAGRTVVVRRVMRAYLSESHNGPYEFLCTDLNRAVDEARVAMVQQLSARFGAADPNPEHAVPWRRQGDYTQAWPVAMAKPLPGDGGALHEAREQWLTLYKHSDSGDGDVWWELWLMAAPSIDALQLAQRARGAGPATEPPGHGGEPEGPDSDGPALDSRPPEGAPATQPPRTRDEWLHAVCNDRHAIAHVPAQWLDDAVVDAALDANVAALEYVPAAWRTTARLESLVRRGLREAAGIPPECMTAEALALARSLYAGQPEWDWRDERNSRIPATWDHNSLCDVWGCLLTPELALKAVRAQAPLKDLAHWLRTDAVEQAALQADIYNISYIDPRKITPALAERAVRHDYGCLIEHIPADMLTPALCLASARANGLSLDKIPAALRTTDVCVAALQDRWDMFLAVPPALREDVTTRLIADDLDQARRDGEPREASHWHVQRAWARLWAGDPEGAMADARLGLGRVRHEEHARYILASALRALGRTQEAALEASTVLSLQSPYAAQWDAAEDTRWLQGLAQGQAQAADDATLIARLQSHPRTLADVPRERITHAMVDAALAADEDTVRFVPKRLMTPARYAAALRQGVKDFGQIPPDMLSEEACIAHVQEGGWRLEQIPPALRTVAVCAHAVRRSASAMEHVPQALHDQAREAAARLPRDDGDAADGTPRAGGVGGWLARHVVDSALKGQGTAARRLQHQGVLAAFLVQAAVTARSGTPPTLTGLAGWFEQRPVLAWATHLLLGLAAWVGHAFVSVAAWRAEGAWIGLGTFALMGFSELYWAWRFVFASPQSPWLAVAAALVVVYLFGWRRLYRRVGLAFAHRGDSAAGD
ncbi:WG repeat-containing protein [Acidovorax sp. sif1233]|uniref:WG repeat-containing protein n=1 Tax=Acidovorax sp. sif1233 TaxID=2854792 RepID=UPI001C4841CE|nr:WG repeat-containing protein [Acidovorax sp. sif1233]MBV7456219.1 WG repeat-containing protein [Acidovorax sp. sif1233]